ncbi:ribosome biogenesis protein SLX9 homolog isoform X1 [Podarcis raffonei]|uniref:ribosome biogenesis protein SLX9 homolog isoform X1 n=1 Tax=Podarcis raffonei TaxID=65483 RepID=UPI002329548B|nr:ribosome biogenesis protein SLX9 homolog isoform X1 [Podarcis raffonei]
MALGGTYSSRPKGAVCAFRARNKALHKMVIQDTFLEGKTFLGQEEVFMTSNVFAGVKIDPKSLVKTLDIDVRSISSAVKGEDEKVLLPKKEKMKLRKERWLQKIENIKLAKQQQKAEAKRKATPVVGDLHPLMDALPELSDMVAVSKFCRHPKTPAKKMLLTNFCQMKSTQKRQVLMQEVAQFHKTISDPLFKASPLTVLGEHLSKRLQLEREGEPF